MNRTLLNLLLAVSLIGGPASAWGRGFGGGGFHGGGGGGFRGGGGYGGGGFRGGDFGGGGFRGGDFGGGGYRGGEFGGERAGSFGGERASGFGGERAGDLGGNFRGGELGGARAGEFGGNFRGGEAPSRSQLNSFLGMPSDGGMHSVSNSRSADGYTVDRGAVEGPRGGVAGGAAVTGPQGNTVARGAAVGPNGGAAAGRAAVGAGGAGVAQGVARGPGGRVAGGTVARGPEGGVAARGFAAGPHGAVAGYGYMSPSARYGYAYGIRTGFHGYNLYTPGWYAAHPGVWAAAGLTAAAWDAATWGSLYGWVGAGATPVDYDYGNTVTAQDDNVYVDGQDAGTTEAYYNQAAQLASDGAAATTTDENWMPLGVFAMSHGNQTSSDMSIQLAVDKQGIIRGNFTDTKSDQTLPVQGSIDKKSQRAAWTIGDKKDEVMETGLYNLTKDEVPALLHYGKDRTEQWMLVRLKQEDKAQDGANSNTGADSNAGDNSGDSSN